MKSMGKGLSTEKIINAFQWCHELDLPTIGYFMVGAPGETRQDFLESKKLFGQAADAPDDCQYFHRRIPARSYMMSVRKKDG